MDLPIAYTEYEGNWRYIAMFWVVPPPRMPLANEDLGWDPLETGGDCYWAGGQPKLG